MFSYLLVVSVVSCGSPAPVANAIVSTTDDAYLTEVTYQCRPGFKREAGGDWTRQCQADKRWSGTPPTCSGKVNFYTAVGI